jgi:hypothetical protein
MSTIITRNSATSGSTPSSLVQGELAINVTDGRLFYGSGSGNIVKEFGTTASNAVSASYAETASYAPAYLPLTGGTISGTLYQSGTFYPDQIDWFSSSIGYDTGSYILTTTTNGLTTYANYQDVASTLASYIPTVSSSISASYAQTASYAPLYLPLTGGTIDGNVTINGTASIAFLNVTYESASVIYSSGSNQFGDASNDVQTLWGTVDIKSGPVLVTGSVIANSFTGSLLGTASYATQALSASYALTASYVNPLNQTVEITGSLQVQNSIDSSLRFLFDSLGTASLDWEDGYLYNGGGSISVDWRDKKLYDSNVDNSVNWDSRQLFKSDGTTVTLDWETGAFTGSMLGTASYATQALSSSYALSASYSPNTTFPYTGSALITGSLGITGSLNVTDSARITNGLTLTGSLNMQAVGGQNLFFNNSGQLGSTATGAHITMTPNANTTFFSQVVTSQNGFNATPGGNSPSQALGVTVGAYPAATLASFTSGSVTALSISGSGMRGTGSFNYLGSISATSFTGSLLGTASYATQALSASFATTASYVQNAQTSSYVSGSVVAPGSTTQIVYNSGSVLGADSGFVYSGSNVGIGTSSPAYKLSVAGKLSLVDGVDSVFIGLDAGKNDDGTSNGNVAIGTSALSINATGRNNVAIGYSSQASGSFSNNTSVGTNTLVFNAFGSNNTAIGSFSQASASRGNFNTGLGTNTLVNNYSGSQNTAVGSSAIFSLTSGSDNNGFGVSTLFSTTTGNDNTAIGSFALTNNVTGSGNTALGKNAGRYYSTGTATNTDSSASIFIGVNSRASAIGGINQIVIGNEALGLGSNTVVLGNDNITTTALKGNVGIGKTNPSTKLDINGNTTITGSLSVTSSVYINNALYSNQTNTLATENKVLYSIPTSTYDALFVEYIAKNGSNARAGQIMSATDGTSVKYTETTTTDIGSTSPITFNISVVGGNIRLEASASTSTWTIKTITRAI